MRRYVLLVLLILASIPTLAGKARNWQEAVVVSISRGDTGTAVVIPVGPNLVGGRIYQTNYRVETDDLIVVLATRGRKPLNVTVNKKTKIAFEKQNAYLVDDDGKEIKLPIVYKEAKQH
jgi:hypothetical protein